MKHFNSTLCKQHFSTKVYRAYFHYLSKNHPQINIPELCQKAGLPFEYVSNEDNWVSTVFDEKLTALCIERTGDSRLCYRVGEQVLSEDVIGKILFSIGKHSSLQFLYGQLPDLTKLFNRVIRSEIIEVRRGYLRLHLRANFEGLNTEEQEALRRNLQNVFENSLGYFTSLPTFQGLPPAEVHYTRYLDSNQAPAYDIRVFFQWSDNQRRFVVMLHLLLQSALGLGGWYFLNITWSGLVALFVGVEFLVSYYRLFSRYRDIRKAHQNAIGIIHRLDERYQNLYESKRAIVDVSKAYERFVPKEFLKFLHHESILETGLGSSVEADLAVLFLDIRDFTSFSEKMGPKDTFLFLNTFLARVVPVIKEHGGFVDKYIGDGIMAIFPTPPDRALSAAIEMVRQVGVFNRIRKENGAEPIEVGLGLNSGKLVLGIIGTSDYMQNTVVSDCVNTASRLENLTKTFGASIVVSDKILLEAQKVSSFRSRYLGSIRPKGKSEMVRCFQIYDGDPEVQILLLEKTLHDFSEAIRMFEESNYSEAARLFKKVINGNSNDLAAIYYLDLIETLVHPSRHRKLGA